MSDDDALFTPVSHDKNGNPNADYRGTLHWHRGSAGANEKWQQQYFNSDLLSSVVVRFYHIPTNGVPILFQDSYKVDPK
ncbi:MAG: hypothetical protein U5K79_23495 [Cyclobacteriaceae bacterium]|nr:hypothetical protein [Cyclobacteriaceae bacterium]